MVDSPAAVVGSLDGRVFPSPRPSFSSTVVSRERGGLKTHPSPTPSLFVRLIFSSRATVLLTFCSFLPFARISLVSFLKKLFFSPPNNVTRALHRGAAPRAALLASNGAPPRGAGRTIGHRQAVEASALGAVQPLGRDCLRGSASERRRSGDGGASAAGGCGGGGD